MSDTPTCRPLERRQARRKLVNSGGSGAEFVVNSASPALRSLVAVLHLQYTAGEVMSVVAGKSYQPFSADEGNSSVNHWNKTRSCKW